MESYARPTAVGHASGSLPAMPRPMAPDPMRATMYGHDVHQFEFPAGPGTRRRRHNHRRSNSSRRDSRRRRGRALPSSSPIQPSDRVSCLPPARQRRLRSAGRSTQDAVPAGSPRRGPAPGSPRRPEADAVPAPVVRARVPLSSKLVFAGGIAAFTGAVLIWLLSGNEPETASAPPPPPATGVQTSAPSAPIRGLSEAPAPAPTPTQTPAPMRQPGPNADASRAGRRRPPLPARTAIAPARPPSPLRCALLAPRPSRFRWSRSRRLDRRPVRVRRQSGRGRKAGRRRGGRHRRHRHVTTDGKEPPAADAKDPKDLKEPKDTKEVKAAKDSKGMKPPRIRRRAKAIPMRRCPRRRWTDARGSTGPLPERSPDGPAPAAGPRRPVAPLAGDSDFQRTAQSRRAGRAADGAAGARARR